MASTAPSGRGGAYYRERGWWRDETLATWLDGAAESAPDRPALVTSEGVRSYDRLRSRARHVAAGLAALGIAPGDVVAAQLPNREEFVVGYLAVGLCRAVFQPVHMAYGPAEMEPLLRHSRARAVIALTTVKDRPLAQNLPAMRQALPDLKLVITVGDRLPGTCAFADLLDATEAPSRATPLPNDPFLLLYTSGTTASPKAVPASYPGFLGNARLCAAALGITADSVVLSAAPFTHLYGLCSFHLALATGATTALLPAFTPSDLDVVVRRERPTHLFTAPAHVAACLNAGLLASDALSSLRAVVISGSACPPELARTVEQRLPAGRVLQLWGMTELQIGALTRPEDGLDVRTTTAGSASPGTELRITSPDGASVPPDTEGELEVHGSSVFRGYLDNPAANAAAFTADGWFRTGDLAVLDAAGHVRITGRLKDLVNRGGVKINPADVEALLNEHPAVLESAIVPMPDPVLGERACCFVTLRDGATFTLDDMRAWLASRNVAKLRWPERVEVVDAMPFTPTRKIMKRELAKRLASDVR